MGLYEFIVLDVNEKWRYVIAQGTHLHTYKGGDHAYMLYKCPYFYAELEFNLKNQVVVDVAGFIKGWKLDKHLDNIKIAMP